MTRTTRRLGRGRIGHMLNIVLPDADIESSADRLRLLLEPAREGRDREEDQRAGAPLARRRPRSRGLLRVARRAADRAVATLPLPRHARPLACDAGAPAGGRRL